MNDLIEIQKRLKAPKGQFNAFGKYKYRSCEDIVEALKPLAHEYGYALIMYDEIVDVAGRVYVRATVRLQKDAENLFSSTAYAREEESKKGMDASQITGAASSYARKYALNGLLAIDDTKDADATNKHNKPELEAGSEAFEKAKEFLAGGGKIEQIEKKYVISDEVKKLLS